MLVFATLFDKNYSSRVEVLYDSIYSFIPNFKLFGLCLDQDVYNNLIRRSSEYPHLELININDLESFYPELIQAKKNRSFVEYIFTLSPFLPLYIFNVYDQIFRVTTLDADMYILGDISSEIENLGNNIGITLHNFSESNDFLNVYGKYNVCFQSFPNTIESMKCLNFWKQNCLDYCGDKLDLNGRYADQKYLDEWKDQFQNVVEFKFPEIGVAPWNLDRFEFQNINSKIYVDNIEVKCYHFHAFRIRNKYYAIHNINQYVQKVDKFIIQLYFKYWEHLSTKSELSDILINRNNYVLKSSLKLFFSDIINNPILINIWIIKAHIDLRGLFFNVKKIFFHG